MTAAEDPLEKFNRLYPEADRRPQVGQLIPNGFDGKLDDLMSSRLLRNNERLHLYLRDRFAN